METELCRHGVTAGLEGEFSDNHRGESQLLSPGQGIVVVDGQAAIACILTPGVWRGRGSIVSQPFQTVGVRAQAGVILSDGQKGS